jgi:Zn-dependent protease
VDLGRIVDILIGFAIVFPAIVLHEIAHGYAAYLMGDDTAKKAGRLTLNPIAHVDPVGTIILPAVMLLLSQGRYFFGWAKPVPFNPHNFANERVGTLITGVAGPVTNITLAFVAGMLSRLFELPGGVWEVRDFTSIASILLYFSYANLVLAFFNLVPIPPLDGSRVVQAFLPDAARRAYYSIEPYGFMLLIGITWLLPGVFGTYLTLTVWPLFSLFTGVR